MSTSRLLTILFIVLFTPLMYAVEDDSHVHNDEALEAQIHQLKQRLMRLESAINANKDSSVSGMNMNSENNADSMSGMNMGGMDKDSMQQSDQGMKMGMGMMKKGKGMMSMMKQDKGMGMMGMMKDKMGMGMGMGKMMMMGMAGSDQKMTMTSALPGFPGASHIYHIGSTGHFLNHHDHISLTTAQIESLNKIKEKAGLKQAEHDRSIAKSEQELWELTAADKPDAESIHKKIKEIAQHTVDKRMDFIRSVGSAAGVLTDHQRHLLQGKSTSDQPDHSSH